jgi:hypothetical protein
MGRTALSASSTSRVLLLLPALVLGVQACRIVRPPLARELVDVGLRRTPEQAFRGFQTALAADLPDEEFRSFSTGFRRTNRLSLATYMEGRRRLMKEQPWVFKVAKAKIRTSKVLDGHHHLLVVSVPGPDLEVGLVREDFWEMWAGDDLLADGLIDFERVVRSPDPERLLAEVALEAGAGVDLARVTELRLGQEWKIDAIRRAEGASP